jgi:hypothetical protein
VAAAERAANVRTVHDHVVQRYASRPPRATSHSGDAVKIIISQMRKSSANVMLPLMRHNGYPVATHLGEMFTAEPGYEICAVYIAMEVPSP